MSWIRERLLPALAVALAAGLLASAPGCHEPLQAPEAAAHPDDLTPRRGGVLHLATIDDIRSLDPAAVLGGTEAQLDPLIYAGLVDIAADGSLAPDLAESWDVSADGLVYRFVLRRGARFHDDSEVTAADVKRSLERALHPSTPDPYASFYESLAGYADYVAGKAPHLAGVEITGPYEVTFRLDHPDATFPKLLALLPARLVCPGAGERYDESFVACGAGPFKMTPGGWERGRQLTLVRHEGYFRPGLPYLDGMNMIFSMPALTQRFKLESGALDVVSELSGPDATGFRADARWASSRAVEPFRQVWGEAMNVETPPFDNVEVRRAVAAALDREQWAKLKPGLLRPTGQLLPPTIEGFRADLPGQVYDPAAARAHMVKAGLAGGWPKPIPYLIVKQDINELTAQLLAEELAPLGLHLDIRLASYPTFMARTHARGHAAISHQGWQQDYPDASDFFEPLFSRAAISDTDSNNMSFFVDDRLETLMTRAHREISPEVRRALYDEAGSIVVDRAPWAFAFDVSSLRVWQPYVRGLRSHAQYQYPIATVWLDRDPREGKLALGFGREERAGFGLTSGSGSAR